MKPRLHGENLLLKISVAGLLCCAVLGYGYWKRTGTTVPRACKVCDAESDHKTLSIFGRLVRTWDTEPEKSDLTRNYFDRYLAYPHEHEWVPYFDFSAHVAPPSPTRPVGLPPRPTGSSGNYPTSRRDLTEKGFQLVAASAIPEPEGRRRYFESIIGPIDRKHCLRVMATWEMIEEQFPHGPPRKPGAARIWSPDMKGITVPAEVKAGELLPDAP
jgi:hypothetical protein